MVHENDSGRMRKILAPVALAGRFFGHKSPRIMSEPLRSAFAHGIKAARSTWTEVDVGAPVEEKLRVWEAAKDAFEWGFFAVMLGHTKEPEVQALAMLRLFGKPYQIRPFLPSAVDVESPPLAAWTIVPDMKGKVCAFRPERVAEAKKRLYGAMNLARKLSLVPNRSAWEQDFAKHFAVIEAGLRLKVPERPTTSPRPT